MTETTVSFLMAVSAFLGVGAYPKTDGVWTIVRPWTQTQAGYMETTLQVDASSLGCNEESGIQFPSMIHAYQEVRAGGVLVSKFGSPTFDWFRSFYGAPIVSCGLLLGPGVVEWRIISPTHYFARIGSWPQLNKNTGSIHQDELMNIAAFGALLILGIYLAVATTGTPLAGLGVSLCVFSIAMSVFFFLSVAGLFGARIPYLLSHRMADLALCIATLSFTQYLVLKHLLPNRLAKTLQASLAFPVLIVFVGDTGDVVQFGTSIMFLPVCIALWLAVSSQFKGVFQRRDLASLTGLIGLLFFVCASTLDILGTVGLHSHGMSMGLGVAGCVFFLAQSLQVEMRRTYEERDYLRMNLQHEVEEKTKSLKARTAELEQTMGQLKTAQAELIQSAKLASLGTLSAGIAHEINNSMNYVRGLLWPLEQMILKSCTEESRPKIQRSLAAMKEGVELTVGIVASLKQYSGINQARSKDVNVREVAESVLTILRSKVRDHIHVKNEIIPDLTVFGSVVGLNQIFMNLITNAIDAMPQGGTLVLASGRDSEMARITISDTGAGIPEQVLGRIFDPFFTTKDVGKGSGLGLYIVRNEIKKHGGTLEVESRPGIGTTFVFCLPILSSGEVAA